MSGMETLTRGTQIEVQSKQNLPTGQLMKSQDNPILEADSTCKAVDLKQNH